MAALVNEDASEPGVESTRVPQTPPVTPGRCEGLLGGIVSFAGIAEDRPGQAVCRVDLTSRQRGKGLVAGLDGHRSPPLYRCCRLSCLFHDQYECSAALLRSCNLRPYVPLSELAGCLAVAWREWIASTACSTSSTRAKPGTRTASPSACAETTARPSNGRTASSTVGAGSSPGGFGPSALEWAIGCSSGLRRARPSRPSTSAQ